MRYSLSPWWDNPAFKKRIRRSRSAISPHHGSVGPDGTFRHAMTTVAQLVEHLLRMPQDARVIYSIYSGFEDLDLDLVCVWTLDEDGGIIEHDGHLMFCDPDWDPLPSEPFLTCVHFPGN